MQKKQIAPNWEQAVVVATADWLDANVIKVDEILDRAPDEIKGLLEAKLAVFVVDCATEAAKGAGHIN